MISLSILLIGDLSRPDFEGVREFLESLGQVYHFTGTDAALSRLASGEIIPDLTVIAQSFPGEFSQQAIDRLRAASPLSRMIALLSSWCEGEMRSGQPWPTVIRLYWHQGLCRIGREIEQLAQGNCPQWGLPLTVSEEERLLARAPLRGADCQSAHSRQGGNLSCDLPKQEKEAKGLVGIAACRCESFEWLSSACRQRGHATLWLRGPHFPRAEGLLAILIDGTDFHRTEFETLQQMSKKYPQARRIAIMDFPRIEDRRRLLQAGAAAVLSKPLCVEDLFAELDSA